MEILAAMTLFAMCMLGLGLGLMIRGRPLESSCGGAADIDPDLGCGVCARDAKDLCPSDEPLVALAQFAHPDPKHHR